MNLERFIGDIDDIDDIVDGKRCLIGYAFRLFCYGKIVV